MAEKVILYTDGGSRGNPGLAGAGVVVTDGAGQILKQLAKPLGTTTNNEAEYRAVILGLETAKRILGKSRVHSSTVEVRLDSELVARQLRGEYQIKEKKLYPFFIKIWNLRVAHFPHLSFTYVPRKDNALADRLANEAMDASGGNNRSLWSA